MDAIIIPTGSGGEKDKERARRALAEEDRLTNKGYFLISGYSQKELDKNNRQVYQIYKTLRRAGIRPKKMGLEGKSHDTRENVIYALEKIRKRACKQGHMGPIKVGIVSYPGHLNRVEDFIEQSEKIGLTNKNEFEFERIETPETEDERKYESDPLRRLRHQYKLHTMRKYKK